MSITWTDTIFADLMSASLIISAIVLVADLTIRIGHIRNPFSRHAVWFGALTGIIMLPVISLYAPGWALPILPPPTAAEHSLGPSPTISPLLSAFGCLWSV